MSKDDRYSHLGGESDDEDTTTDDEVDADEEDASTIRVTIGEGADELSITVDADDASTEDIREAVQKATSESSTDTETPPSLIAANIRSTTAMQRATMKVGLAATGMALGGVAAYRRLKSSRD